MIFDLFTYLFTQSDRQITNDSLAHSSLREKKGDDIIIIDLQSENWLEMRDSIRDLIFAASPTHHIQYHINQLSIFKKNDRHS